MRLKYLAAFLVFASISPALLAKEPQQGKLLKELWEAAYLGNVKVGHQHAIHREITIGNHTVIEAATELHIDLLRFKQPIRLQFAMANHETTDGRMLAFAIRQTLSKDQEIARTGKISGKELIVTTRIGDQPAAEKKIPCHPRAMGLFSEEQCFTQRELEPGTKLDLVRFDPTFNAFLNLRVEIIDWEEVALLDGRKTKLLRVEKQLEKVLDLELAPEIIWIDKQGEIHKRQIELPGIGDLVAYRTTQEAALAKADRPPVDVGLAQLVKLDQAIPDYQTAREVILKIRVQGAKNPGRFFPADDRQEVRDAEDGRCEITLRPSGPPQAKGVPGQAPPAEYLKSNQFITSDDDRVKAHARQAVGDQRDPWKKALRIETWVKQNMRGGKFTDAFATAAEAAKNLEGDCTEHALLAAAMCRAAGIPARTAVGLVYSPHDRALAFHMWFEVCIDGQWAPLDATLGLGRITAAHLKIADAHWNDVHSFTPLIPVARVLGKLQVELGAVKPAK